MSREPRVVAVVCSFWPSRRENVAQIIRDLQAGTRTPDRILVVNNHPDEGPTYGVDQVHIPWNAQCRGKFIAALLDVADYYLLLDDDTSVGTETLETLLSYAHPGICTGYLGCGLTEEGSVWHGPRWWPKDVTEVTPVATFCGCAMFCSFRALAYMVMAETFVRVGSRWTTEGDDILLGFVNKSVVVPLRGAAAFVDLGYQNAAMCHSIEGYYEMRDEFTRHMITQLNRMRAQQIVDIVEGGAR